MAICIWLGKLKLEVVDWVTGVVGWIIEVMDWMWIIGVVDYLGSSPE